VNGPTPHLSWAEIAASDGTPYPLQWRSSRALVLAWEFEAIREACGLPIRVTSCYRTGVTNVATGGATTSQHLFGRALDLVPPMGISYPEFYQIVLTRAESHAIIRGVGRNLRNFHVHMDTRPGDVLFLWDE